MEETFLGTILGIDIVAKTKDKAKIKAISDYLERARQALMFRELSTGSNWSLKKVFNRKYGKGIINELFN